MGGDSVEMESEWPTGCSGDPLRGSPPYALTHGAGALGCGSARREAGRAVVALLWYLRDSLPVRPQRPRATWVAAPLPRYPRAIGEALGGGLHRVPANILFGSRLIRCMSQVHEEDLDNFELLVGTLVERGRAAGLQQQAVVPV